MKQRKLNAAQKNYKKQQKKALQDQRTAEMGKIVGWIILGVLLLPTIIAPYIAYGYVKNAMSKRKELLDQISSM